MSDLLVVLNPRDIPECIAAIRELPIDKLYVSRMTEYEVMEAWPQVMEIAQGYDRLIVQSDDGIARRHALKAVQQLLDEGHPVVTGYSNLSVSDHRVNLSKRPLDTSHPHEGAYTFYDLQEVQEHLEPVVPTYVVAFALTGMAYELWERFPFRVYNGKPGNASDYMLSCALQTAGVPMVAARDAFVWHGKPRWGMNDAEARRRLLLEEPSEIRLEKDERWCQRCGGDASDNWFDRSLCPCDDAMHTRCRNCGAALDGCEFEESEAA